MTEVLKSETVFADNWPDTINPATLFDSDGEVDYVAVSAYLQSIKSTKDTTEVSVLGQVSTESYVLTVDMNDPKPSLPAKLDVAQWKQDHPIDYAITAYVRHLFYESLKTSGYLSVSPHIDAEPNAKLHFQNELNHFLHTLQTEQAANFEFVEKVHPHITKSANEVNELECIVAIPVAGHQEYGNIFHTLEQFAVQTLDPSKFEIVLHLNLPGKNGENDEHLAENLNNTLGEIARFRIHYPRVQVREIITTYRGSSSPIGGIRADLWNAIAYDMSERGRTQDIMLVSSDADIISLNNKYLTEMNQTFCDSDVDIVTAELRWQPAPGLYYNSLTNRILRYQTFLDGVRDRHADAPHTADANTGISLAAYMAVGGYDRSAVLGEMRGIVNRICYYRQPLDQRAEDGYIKPEQPVVLKTPGASLRTHSRRLVKAMALGYSPYHAWDQKLIEFGSDDNLRTEQMQSQAAEDAAQQHAKEWISSMTGPYMDGVDPIKKRRILKTAHALLGFTDVYSARHN